jgi:hypothetical protein
MQPNLQRLVLVLLQPYLQQQQQQLGGLLHLT